MSDGDQANSPAVERALKRFRDVLEGRARVGLDPELDRELERTFAVWDGQIWLLRRLARVWFLVWQMDAVNVGTGPSRHGGLCLLCQEPTEGYLQTPRGSGGVPLCSACWSAVCQEPP